MVIHEKTMYDLYDIAAYCKFGKFREAFIFANGIKRHICDVIYSRQRHDLPISVNAISRGFLFSRNFANAKFRENKTLAKISEFTVSCSVSECGGGRCVIQIMRIESYFVNSK